MKKPERIDFTVKEYQDLKDRIIDRNLTEADYSILSSLLESNAWLVNQLQENQLSIKRLKKIFGIQTEKIVSLNKTDSQNLEDKNNLKKEFSQPSSSRGHGRLKTSEYNNVETRHYSLTDLQIGIKCPDCLKGNIFDTDKPGRVITIKGNPSLQATLHLYDRFRCSGCGKIFKPELPVEVLKEKYDFTAKTIITLLRYQAGFPHYRLEQFQSMLGIPLPRSTQWDCIRSMFAVVESVWLELIEYGANGNLIHNDDTGIKILQCMKENKISKPKRTGTFTSIIVSYVEEIKIILFFSSRKHAGENLIELLQKRDKGLPTPIQMCDALSRNMSNKLEVVLSNCLTHARRYFFDIYDVFARECLLVLDHLKIIYRNDAYCKDQQFSPDERLLYHQENSTEHMSAIKQWGEQQLNEKHVEPNSSLGEAIQYFLNHYPELTEFLRTPGVPLTNDICERVVKTGIRHRKNSLFYKTLNGAMIGDCMMSLIQTCIYNKVNPYDYFNALQNYEAKVKKNPESWFPWNYQEQIQNTS